MATGREPMESTMIRVSIETRDLLNKEKIIPREPHNDCIKRILSENRKFKKMFFTTQTKERMETEIKNFVLNPGVPDTRSNEHREIWLLAHPGETLGPDELIHHKNGNHNDNRPENLEKVDAKHHAKAHADLKEPYQNGV